MIARVINLDPSGERWDGFTASAQAAGVQFKRFPAVDTRAITTDSVEARQVRLMPGVLKAMVGCTLSHLALWQECVEADAPMLILEDDARFVEGVWDAAAVEAVDSDVDVLVLQTTSAPGIEESDGPLVPVRGNYRFSTAAYRITPRGAAALLAYCRREWSDKAGEVPTHEHEGKTSFYRVPFIVDRFIRQVAITGDVNVRMLIPNPVAHSGVESTITDSDFLVPMPKRKKPAEKSLASRKRTTLRSFRRLASRRLVEGIEINGITLAARDSDQQAFTRLLTLIREAYDLQPDAEARQTFLATPQVITDIHGHPHTLPNVRRLRNLLVAYGIQLRDLWTAEATRKAQIAAATTHEELDAILAAD